MTAYPKTELPGVTIYQGSCLDVLPTLPEKSVHACITSPPYWSLRDYGTAEWEGGSADCDHTPTYRKATQRKSSTLEGGQSTSSMNELASRAYKDTCGKCGARRVDQQLGLEARLSCGYYEGKAYLDLMGIDAKPCEECWICHQVQVFAGVHRVLRDDGCCFVNIGDSYASNGHHSHTAPTAATSISGRRGKAGTYSKTNFGKSGNGLKAKDLCLQPARLALALQAWGWYVRSEVVWVKVSPMPESCTDRPTCAHEKIFLLTKKPTYFYDADSVREPAATSTLTRVALADNRALSEGEAESKATLPDDYKRCKQARVSVDKYQDGRDHLVCAPPANGRNQRNVWTLSPSSFSESHFATFPPDLPKRAILAGTSEKGVCPCCGAPWVRVMSMPEGRPTYREWLKGQEDTGKLKNLADNGRGQGGSLPRYYQEVHGGKSSPKQFTGWRASCTCPHTEDEVQPATVLDPFAGAGTTLLVAAQLGRRGVGIELNPDYISMSARRIAPAAAQETLRF